MPVRDFGGEEPPQTLVWLSAVQHVGVVSVYLAFPLTVMREGGASVSDTMAVLALSFVAMGVATTLQSHRRLGSGLLCPVGCTAVYVGPSIVAYHRGGLPMVFGMTVFAGCVEMAVAPFLRRLRALFPPEISGLVVLLVGVTIGSLAVRDLPGSLIEGADPQQWITFLITFVTIGGLSVWGTLGLRRLAVLTGMVAGFAFAYISGVFSGDDIAAIEAEPLLAFPRVARLGIAFDPALILPFVIAALATTAKAAGVLSLAHRAAAGSSTPEPRVTARGVFADGLGTAIAGLCGTAGLSVSPSSAALVAATGVTSPRVAWATGAIFAVFAFLPPLSQALARLPTPVVAGAMLFCGCLVLTSGLQMIAASRLDNRKTLVVGLGVISALAIEAHPHIAAHAPAFMSPIMGSSLVLGATVGIGLTLLLRIGARQCQALTMPSAESSNM